LLLVLVCSGAGPGDRTHSVLTTLSHLSPLRAGDPELDSQRFAKLCKECGLTDRRFSNGYADVAFTLAKKNKKEQRRSGGGRESAAWH
jgi:hypothetical protein